MHKVMTLKPHSMCVFVNAFVIVVSFAREAVKINSSHEWLDTFPIVYSCLVDSIDHQDSSIQRPTEMCHKP